jgi:Bacterial Ig domain
MDKRFSRQLVVLSLAASLSLTASGQQSTSGIRSMAQRSAVVNFAELAERHARAPASAAVTHQARHRPKRRTESVAPELSLQSTRSSEQAASELLTLAPASPGPSPAPAASFLALADDNTVIPPDTMGAVGPNHVMAALNSQVQIQDRSGGIISTVSMDSFWSSLGNPDAFDPHVTYDAFNDRWIFTAAANDTAPDSEILVAVSATSDPTGNWFLYSADVDAANLVWADYDNLGCNKDWIAVTANLFRISNDSFDGVGLFIFDKTDLYTNGPGSFTMLESLNDNAFSMAPAITHDNSLDTLYLVEDWIGSIGQLRISTITGSVGSEVLNVGTAFVTTTNRWETFNFPDNLAPQLGSTHGIDVGDARVLTCLYRNGSLWATQNALVPAGSPKYCAAQWWQFHPDGTLEQFGRVEDPSRVRFYAYPTLAVNASNDVLVGYSRFSASQYASANYSFRFGTDPLNTLRTDTTLKDGEGVYYVTDGANFNRWGDYSSTVVDPVNDMTLWTIQECAGIPVGSPAIDGSGRWSTWWGRIDPDLSSLKILLTHPADGMSFPTNATVTLVATQLDSNVTFSNVEFFADTIKLGETNASPFAITWNNVADGAYALTARATDTMGNVATSVVVNITVGDLTSPVGTWECKLSGFGKGTAYVTFNDDFTLSGYGMTLGTFGLFMINGNWNFNSQHQTTGTYTEMLDETELLNGSFTAKVTSGRKFKTAVTPTAPGAALKLKGIPLAPAPNLNGDWAAVVKTLGITTNETYNLAPSATYTNVLDLTGVGPTYVLTGSVIVTSRGALNVSTTNAVMRSLSGKSKKGSSLTLKGTDESGNSVKIKATMP